MLSRLLASKDVILDIVRGSNGLKDSVGSVKSALLKGTGRGELLPQEDKALLAHAFRFALDDLLNQSMDDKKKITELGMERLMDLSIECTKGGLLVGVTAFHLLEDLFEGQTISECQTIFAYLESRVGEFKQSVFLERGKLPLIKFCNAILRRLSKANDTVFCGRVRTFLASMLALTEASGVNKKGAFNDENTTEWENPDDVDQMTDDTQEASEAPIDYKFYQMFWSLQEHFRAPSLLAKDDNWRTFTTSMDKVLDTFESNSFKEQDGSRDETEGDSFYWPKFLSSSKLINLQLRDPKFRRHILVQFLILFQFLEATPVQKVQDGLALNENQKSVIKGFTTKVLTLVEQTPPDGKAFRQDIEHILGRERAWMKWKEEGCNPFEKPRQSSNLSELAEEGKPKKKQRRQYGPDLSNAKWDMGSEALTYLWSLGDDDLEFAKDEGRVRNVSLEEFLEPVKDEMNDDLDNEWKRGNDKVFCWQALRLMRKAELKYLNEYTAAVENPLESVVIAMQNKDEKNADAKDGANKDQEKDEGAPEAETNGASGDKEGESKEASKQKEGDGGETAASVEKKKSEEKQAQGAIKKEVAVADTDVAMEDPDNEEK